MATLSAFIRPFLLMALAAAPASAAVHRDSLPPRPEIRTLASAPASPIGVGVPARFTVSAFHPEGAPLEFSWDFDDDSPRTAWSRADSALLRAYARPGLYSVRVRVRDTAGMEAARILRLQVSATGAAVPPASSPLALDAGARRLWVANPDHNSVSLIHADSLIRIREEEAGLNPQSVALDPEGNAWVACRGSDEIRILSRDGGRSLASISLGYGSGPAAIVFEPAGATAYVSLEGAGRIAQLDVATRSIRKGLDVGPTPRALAVSADGGRLLAARFISAGREGMVWSIALPAFAAARAILLPLDSTTLESGTAGRGLPNLVSGLAIHPDGKSAWYASKKDNILQGLARDGNPLTFETTHRTLVSQLDLDAAAERVSARLDLDNTSRPSALAFAPHGNILFLTLQGNDKLYALDADSREVLAIQETGPAPQGICVDAAGGRVFVQDFLGRTVSVYAAGDMLRAGADTLARIAVVPVSSREPLGPAILAGKRIFHNAGDGRMSQDGYTSCAACHPEGGHDGRVWDFTDRGEGLRNTTTLLGKAGTGHGPLHWSANFDEVQDFEHDLRGAFGGKGLLAGADFAQGTRNRPLGDLKAGASPDLDALAAYVTSLAAARRSPYRNPDGTLTPQAVRGEAVFRRPAAGCAACHAGAAYTDSRLPPPGGGLSGPVSVFPGAASRYTPEGFLLHDVGTLKPASGRRLDAGLPGLDTPTLIGIWETAPYLHDGSAPTIADVLDANPGDAHGRTSDLTAQEKEDLAAFLMQLDASVGAAGPSDRAAPFRPASPHADLAAMRAPGGRLLGLRLRGAWKGPLPDMDVYGPGGRRIASLPAKAWRALSGPPGSGWFLAWPGTGRAAQASGAGVFVIRARGAALPALMITSALTHP